MNANNYQKTHWSAVEMQQREAILQLANSPHIKSENNCNNSNASNNDSILINNNNNNNLLCNNNVIFLQQQQQQQNNQQIQQQYMAQLQYNNYNQQQLQQQQPQNDLDFYYTPPAVQQSRQQPSHQSQQQPQPLMPQQHAQSLNTHQQQHHQQPQQQPEQHHQQQQRLQLPYNSPQSLQQLPQPNPQHQLSRYVLLQQAHRQHMLQPQHQQQQQQQPHQHQTHQQQHGGQQLASVDGMQSGVPTLTTPTLTPTTLRSIEETFIQITQEPSAPYQAGFIPPSFNTDSCGPLASTATTSLPFSSTLNGLNEPDNSDSEDSPESWEGTVNYNEDNSQATDDTSSAATDSTSFQNGLNGLGNNSHATSNASSTNDFSFALAAGKGNLLNNKSLDIPTSAASTSTPRRNQGGRRPAKATNMSPEEEEKRRVRRERNKMAAARCRKRRVDQTNELLDEVAALEKKREQLQREVEQLNTEKGDLHYLIQAHLPSCQIRSQLKNAYESLLGGASAASATTNNSHASSLAGLDETLASAAGRSNSPIDLKPMLSDNSILSQIKSEPLDVGLDSNSSDGEPSPKRILRANPMIPPPLPNVATLSPSLAAAAAVNSSLNTPVVTMAPVSFSSFCNNSNTTLNALNSTRQQMKQRPNSLPMQPRNLGLNVDAAGHKAQPPTEINGVAIQTPSTGTFNYDSLMDGGTGLTPVSGPLIPTCSSQNKHPLELATPTSEPSKLVSL